MSRAKNPVQLSLVQTVNPFQLNLVQTVKICVLCGYGGGAMTRVQKARPICRPFCQALLQTWQEMKNENACTSVLEEDDDNETLLSATNSMQLSGASSVGGTSGTNAKKREAKPRECESCECVDTRDDEGSVCKLCGKENTPEPGSSAASSLVH